jgi:hypothetical protein
MGFVHVVIKLLSSSHPMEDMNFSLIVQATTSHIPTCLLLAVGLVSVQHSKPPLYYLDLQYLEHLQIVILLDYGWWSVCLLTSF